MKKIQLVAGFASLVLVVILYILGYTKLFYEIGNGQMLIYPAGFFALLGLVLIYRAVRNARKTR